MSQSPDRTIEAVKIVVDVHLGKNEVHEVERSKHKGIPALYRGRIPAIMYSYYSETSMSGTASDS